MQNWAFVNSTSHKDEQLFLCKVLPLPLHSPTPRLSSSSYSPTTLLLLILLLLLFFSSPPPLLLLLLLLLLFPLHSAGRYAIVSCASILVYIMLVLVRPGPRLVWVRYRDLKAFWRIVKASKIVSKTRRR